MSAIKNNLSKQSNEKLDEDLKRPLSRSASHSRPPSSAGQRSKIPTNSNQNQNRSGTSTNENQRLSGSPVDAKASNTRLMGKNYNSKSKNKSSPNDATRRVHENQYSTTKKRYSKVKKDIEDKQRHILKLSEELGKIREKIINDGGKDPGKIEDFKLSLNNQSKYSNDQNSWEAIDADLLNNGTMTKDFICKLKDNLNNFFKSFDTFSEEMIDKYSDLYNWMEKLSHKENLNKSDILNQLTVYKNNENNLKLKLDSFQKKSELSNLDFFKDIHVLVEKNERLYFKLKEMEVEHDSVIADLKKKLNNENEKVKQLKEKKIALNSDLINANNQIKSMENTLKDNKLKIEELEKINKNLEVQMKQKDTNFEKKSREFEDNSKRSQELLTNIQNQRNTLELQLNELKEKFEKEKEKEIEVERDEYEKKFKEVNDKAEEFREELNNYKQSVVTLEQEKLSLEEEKLLSERELSEQLKEQCKTIELLTNQNNFLRENDFSLQNKTAKLEEQVKTLSEQLIDTRKMEHEEYLPKIENLCKEINDLNKKNKELEGNLEQVKLQLQKQDRLLKERNDSIKMQDQMITRLKEKDLLFENNFDKKLNKNEQSETVHQLYKTLETKETRIVRLEKLVKQMEEQETRAQEQRTRMEKKIAGFELALQNKNKDCRLKSKGFSIL